MGHFNDRLIAAKMEMKIQHMKDVKKALYEAPKIGDLGLMLERTILAQSELETPNTSTDATNEGVYWVSEY